MTDYERGLLRLECWKLISALTFPDKPVDGVPQQRALGWAEKHRWANELFKWCVEDAYDAAV